MAVTPQRGPGVPLPVLPLAFPQSTSRYHGFSVGGDSLHLAAGETFVVPAGQWLITPGPRTFIQFRDPVIGDVWRNLAQTPNSPSWITSDGQNVRLANLTGCALGALITNVGSGYTSAPAVAASAGNSKWRAIVGGAISNAPTIVSGGAGYVHPPVLLIEPPPPGGVQATATAGVSAGAINAITVHNQGGGYLTAPRITVIPDPRDSVTAEANITTALTGSGTIAAVVCTDHGDPVAAVPTLSFSGGGGASAAATAVMCFAATNVAVSDGGAGYGTSLPVIIESFDGRVAGTPGAIVNPAIDRELLQPRQASIRATSEAGGTVANPPAALRIIDSGLFSAIPLASIRVGGDAVATAAAVGTITVGGVADLSLIQSL